MRVNCILLADVSNCNTKGAPTAVADAVSLHFAIVKKWEKLSGVLLPAYCLRAAIPYCFGAVALTDWGAVAPLLFGGSHPVLFEQAGVGAGGAEAGNPPV